MGSSSSTTTALAKRHTSPKVLGGVPSSASGVVGPCSVWTSAVEPSLLSAPSQAWGPASLASDPASPPPSPPATTPYPMRPHAKTSEITSSQGKRIGMEAYQVPIGERPSVSNDTS